MTKLFSLLDKFLSKMTDKTIFPDGSIIEAVDRETIKYSEGKFSLFVWADFDPEVTSFFGRRIIGASSIEQWDVVPEGHQFLIDHEKKKEIINKIQQFFELRHTKCKIVV